MTRTTIVLGVCLAGMVGCSHPAATSGTGRETAAGAVERETPVTTGGSLRNFAGKIPHTLRKHALVQYDFKLKDELFYVHVPENYNGSEAFGILAFIAPGDSMALPEGWDVVLKDHKLIYIAPQKAGNTFPVSRRAGLTLAGILKLTKLCKIDPNRIYVTGLSGGGRVAVRLAFFHPELIAGALPCGGADFYEAVPKVHAAQTDEYGTVPVDAMSASMTRIKDRVSEVCGSKP